jgi:transposase
MATSGKGTGIVGYNVQAAVDVKHHLIVAHEVTNVGHDRGQLANMARQVQAATGHEHPSVLADRGYYAGTEVLACEQDGSVPYVPKPWTEVLACEQDGSVPYVPKPLTSGAKADGRFGKQDFVYVPRRDIYRCPAGQHLAWHFNSVEDGRVLRNYWTTKCQDCPIKARCTPTKERRIRRWEHEDVLDAMQKRLDQVPQAMTLRRQTVEHLFGTLKAWMGATHFQTKTLKRVSTEMSLHVLAYNLKRVIAIMGVGPLMAAIPS